MKLDKFHFQEAIHMADFIRRIIESELREHWTYDVMHDLDVEHLDTAMDELYKYYCALARKQDEMEEK
jgi:hypothetical protein